MLTYILKNLNILNGILLGAVALLVCFLVVPFLFTDIRLSIPKVPPSSVGKSEQTPVAVNPSPADFALISDQNLFHPERRIPPVNEERIASRPEIVLYGTLLAGDMSIAFIEDKRLPRTTPGRGKRQIAARKGYTISGYILRQIEPDRVVFVKGQDRIVVRLEEGEKRRGAETTTQVAPVSPQQAAPGVPSQIQKGKTPSVVPVPKAGSRVVVPGTKPHSR